MKRIAIYAPFDANVERLATIKRMVQREAQDLGLKVTGPFVREDSRICVFYEDDETKCFIYVDDYDEPLNIEKAALTIRLMATISMAETMKLDVEA